MRFEETKFASSLNYRKIEFSFGDFYLCENYVISELNEGIHFDWDKILEVIGAMIDYYGHDIKIGYISNRVEAYSIDPQLWLRFHKEFDFIIAIATVAYNDFGYINASIEKLFAKISLKRCNELSEAISWISHLKEFDKK